MADGENDIPWKLITSTNQEDGKKFIVVNGPSIFGNKKVCVIDLCDENVADYIIKACNEYPNNQKKIINLVSAIEGLIELSWKNADLPNDLAVIVVAQNAVADATKKD